MDEMGKAITGIVTAIIGVAILSVIISSRAQTSGVIQSLSSGLGNVLAVATSPVTGNTATPNLSYSGSGSSGSGSLGIGGATVSLSGLNGLIGSLGTSGDTSGGWGNLTQTNY